jgi:hypothetical protein
VAPVSSAIAVAASVKCSSPLAQRAKKAPSLANPKATARPRPLLAPATKATLPFIPKSIYNLPTRNERIASFQYDVRVINPKLEARSTKQIQNQNFPMFETKIFMSGNTKFWSLGF